MMLDSLTPLQTSLMYFAARVTILCSFAAILVLFLQRRAADLAHRVWVSALAGVLVLPFLAAILPAWNLEHSLAARPVLQPLPQPVIGDGATVDVHTNEELLVQAEQAEPEVLALTDGRVLLPTDSLVLPEHGAAPVNATAADSSGETSLGSVRSYVRIDWATLLMLIWMVGASILLLRLVGAALLLAKLVRSSVCAPDEFIAWTTEIAHSLGVRQRYQVRLLPAGAMPMACWMGRWTVLVPADILGWPVALRRTVMAHELGHVVRRDAFSDLLAQVVCRVLWPHPLMWLAERAIPRLRERACDDWVLASGCIEPRDYAGHLIEVIKRSTGAAPMLAPAMARTSDLESRLRALLARRSSNSWRNPAVRMLMVVSCLCLTGMLAGARVVGRAEIEAGQTQQAVASSRYAEVQRTIDPTPAGGPCISVGGLVVAPDGKPIAGAELFLRAKIGGQYYSSGLQHNRDVWARTKSNPVGEFNFDKIAIPPRFEQTIDSLLRLQGGVQIIALAEGRGLRWRDVMGLSNKESMRLVLTPEAKVTGVVLDKEDKGVADVHVNLWGATKATTDVDTFFRQPGDLNLVMSEIAITSTSDKEGRFTLHHVPSDYRLLADAEGPRTSRSILAVDTGDHKELTQIHMVGGGGGTLPLVRSPLRVVVERQQFLTVLVTDHQGKAVTDGFLRLSGEGRQFGSRGTLGSRGEAQLAIKNPGPVVVLYDADPLHPRVGVSRKYQIAAGDANPVVELRLPEPKWVSGRVVDADSGKGIVGAYVVYRQAKPIDAEESAAHSMAVSGADGEFRIPAMPGPGMVWVQGSVFGYFNSETFRRSLKTPIREEASIDVQAAGELAGVKIELARGLVIRGVVRDLAGKPVAGTMVEVQTDNQPFRDTAVVSDSEGRFEVGGFSPHAGMVLSISNGAGASTATVTADPNAPMDRTLIRQVEIPMKRGVTLSGRVLYQGKPRAGMPMKLWRSIGSDKRKQFPSELKTDADGYYKVQGLEVGDSYHFGILDPDGMNDPTWQYQMPYHRTVAAGSAEIRLPDVNLASQRQTLKGVVVDPQGKPLEGVTVSASRQHGEMIPRPATGPPPWTKTDNKGKFELRQLPDMEIELMAYIANPKGGRIYYPGKVQAKMNQQDIRIILDPSLAEGVEDLDAAKPGEKKK